VIGQKSVSKHV